MSGDSFPFLPSTGASHSSTRPERISDPDLPGKLPQQRGRMSTDAQKVNYWRQRLPLVGTGVCDVAEACATANTCPTDVFQKLTSLVFRSSAGACDLAELHRDGS